MKTKQHFLLVPLPVTEAVRLPLNHFDLGVAAFSEAIGDAVIKAV